jgi:hypothetical protein
MLPHQCADFWDDALVFGDLVRVVQPSFCERAYTHITNENPSKQVIPVLKTIVKQLQGAVWRIFASMLTFKRLSELIGLYEKDGSDPDDDAQWPEDERDEKEYHT